MENTAPETQEPPSQLSALFKIRVAMTGLAQDIWHDGNDYPDFLSFLNQPKASSVAVQTKVAAAQPAQPKGWKADRIKILEKMWGSGRVIPGSQDYWVNLTAPLGLTSEMSVLDLSSGIGGLPRYIAEEYGAYVTGLESDPLFAARGMILSIAAGKSKHASVTPYDPTVYTASRKYDCILARELFFRVIGKEDFFKAVDESLKNGGGQLVFTDFLLDAADRERPAIKSWLESEENASPLSSIEMIKMWKTKGYDVRVSEDQTEEYKIFIIKGLASFVQFLSEHKPDPESKINIIEIIEIWAKRYMALKEGLKYHRIYAIKR